MRWKTASLPEEIRRVVLNKGTEAPYSGKYDTFGECGTYLCRQCGLALFRSATKFHSGCGWPSFDEEISGAVHREIDADGSREEILCSRCHSHLGHVFVGENLTDKNTRHCVNSVSLDFVTDIKVSDTEEAILAAGCFWGVEYYFQKLAGVLKTEVGYTGGSKDNPSYEDICQGNTGHLEAIRVVYDPQKVCYKDILRYFFEIHDPTQTNGQGPDIGEQYQSAVFYYDETQKVIAQEVRDELISLGYQVATKMLPISVFWPAEKYHQDYYAKHAGQPYCHHYVKKFI